jgi:hypothetical protein
MTASRKKKMLVAGLLSVLGVVMLLLVVGPKRTARVIA